MTLLAPMLARSAPLPLRGAWAFEPKWDGVRALVSTLDGFGVRSRRGWDMTALLPELAALPPGLVLDGELVALRRGCPHFPDVCRRLLQRDASVPLTFAVFDVLALDGKRTTPRPYSKRRRLLERLELGRGPWFLTPTFDDGEALFAAVCAHALEGVVRKPLVSRYLSGERGWVKVKNRAYWRYPLELEAAREARRPKLGE